jgi:hypothetical protein
MPLHQSALQEFLQYLNAKWCWFFHRESIFFWTIAFIELNLRHYHLNTNAWNWRALPF